MRRGRGASVAVVADQVCLRRPLSVRLHASSASTLLRLTSQHLNVKYLRVENVFFFFFLLHIFLRVGQFLLSSLSWPGSCDQARCRSVFPAPGKRRHKEEAKVTAHQLELVLFSRTMAADRFIQIHSSLRFHFWPPFTLR